MSLNSVKKLTFEKYWIIVNCYSITHVGIENYEI